MSYLLLVQPHHLGIVLYVMHTYAYCTSCYFCYAYLSHSPSTCVSNFQVQILNPSPSEILGFWVCYARFQFLHVVCERVSQSSIYI